MRLSRAFPGQNGISPGRRDKRTEPGTIQGNPGRLATMMIVYAPLHKHTNSPTAILNL